MIPELARRAISAYSEPRDLVVDPMCGIGTTLVEAIHLDRNALGIELEQRWVQVARANLAHAARETAGGRARVIKGDARLLPRLVRRAAGDVLDDAAERDAATAGGGKLARLGAGCADLILTSPPYDCDIQTIDKPAWIKGGSLGAKDTRNYSSDRGNLGHARCHDYRAAMADVYAACAAALKPGGFLVVVTKNLRGGGALNDLAGATVALCQQAGLLYWQHVIALHAAVRDGALVPRPSFWQLSTTRKALARGERLHLVCHEDVLVFRKPDAASAAAPAKRGAATRRAA